MHLKVDIIIIVLCVKKCVSIILYNYIIQDKFQKIFLVYTYPSKPHLCILFRNTLL